MKPGVSAPLGAALLLALAMPASPQGMRITGVSTAQYIDMRPVVLDSVPVGQVTGNGVFKVSADGHAVECTEGDAWCRYLRPAAVISAVPLIQDVEVSAWGLATGLRAYAQLRFRAAEGDAARFWPSADQAFEAMAAYLELDRGSVLARIGRQWKTSGLGFYNFDGATLSLQPRSWLTLEGFGGRSLVRGLNQSVVSPAIAAVEPWSANDPDWLMGAEIRVRPSPRLSAGALYQRDIRSDAAGLYSERVAADARLRLGRGTLSGNLQTDLATGDVNDARLRLELPRLLGFLPTLEARHYQPYFELWTIWGAFAPVGYDEATASAYWTDPSDRVSLHLSGGRRQYGPATGGMASLPLRNDGWRAGADATIRSGAGWTVNGGYAADVGFGAARTDQLLGVRRQFGAGYAGLTGMAFQTLDEFQVDKGRVLGASADVGMKLPASVRIDASLQAYRHAERYSGGIDWNQLRGLIRFEWTIGPEPGRGRLPGGAR